MTTQTTQTTQTHWKSDRRWDGRLQIVDDSERVIAWLNDVGPRMTSINAAMIAAAPALLAALEAITADIEAYADDWNSAAPTDVTVCLPVLRAALVQARDA